MGVTDCEIEKIMRRKKKRVKRIIFSLVFPAVLLLGDAGLFAGNFDHSGFDRILQKYVKNGRVNYKVLKTDHQTLATYLRDLEEVSPADFHTWSREEKLAFWINAYNAITIEGILRNYPIQPGGFFSRRRFPRNSIRQIKDFWDTVFIRPLGQNLTLNQIEHEILRKGFHEPRIHFALVCASLGCPQLPSRAFSAEHLEQQLQAAARNFIRNPAKVRLEKSKNILYLSAIFNWYKGDFSQLSSKDKRLMKYKKNIRGVVTFLLHYLSKEEKNFILQNHPKIKYLPYDWTLNEQ